MPLIKVTENVINQASVAATQRTAAPFTTIDLTKATQFSATVKLTYGASSTAPAILEIYGSVNGTDFDTIPFLQAALTVLVGTTVQLSVDIPASLNYAIAKVYNSDASVAITNVRVDVTVQEAS